jgi:hypothetical protein
MGDHRFVRTPAGQAEIQARALNLPRHQRNLLLVVQPDRPGEDWLAQVRGCTAEDLSRLLALGLIEARPVPAGLPRTERPAAVPPPTASAPRAEDPAATPDKLAAQVRRVAYAPLYDALTAHARSHLGLIGGYRFALEVERCSGADELRALAQRYVEQLRARHDQAGLDQFAALLSRPA